MSKSDDYWERWNHFQKYGFWPKSDNKSKEQFKKVIPPRIPSPEEKWEKGNPELSAYDENGNPIEKEE